MSYQQEQIKFAEGVESSQYYTNKFGSTAPSGYNNNKKHDKIKSLIDLLTNLVFYFN